MLRLANMVSINNYGLSKLDNYCPPISNIYSVNEVRRIRTFDWLLRKVDNHKHAPLNIKPFKDQSTVEIRLHSSSTNDRAIQIELYS